jgi:hypothetical protein
MTDEEQRLADAAYQVINQTSHDSERSQQAQLFKVGVSDLGHCQEFTRRMIIQEPETDQRDYLAAFLGTAIGDHVEAALNAKWPKLRRHVLVVTTLEGDQGVYELPGHPDLLGDDLVIDVKTVAGLEKVRRLGPSQQQLFQRHTYALGAHQAGLFTVPLEQVRTANLWVDRSGSEPRFHAHMDTYNPEVTRGAAAWLDDVVYAVRHNEEAQREPSREFCQRWCSRFTACRAHDTDVHGLLTDPEVLTAVAIYNDASELERQVKRMRTEAQIALKETNGSTGTFTVRWVVVPEGDVAYHRRGYQKLSITPIRK